MPWLSNTPVPCEVLYKTAIPNTGLDGSTYLWFILEHYYDLPEWTLFMHAHEFHWHHSLFSSLKKYAD